VRRKLSLAVTMALITGVGFVTLLPAPTRPAAAASTGEEIVTGAGPGGGPHVQVFSSDGTPASSFFAYDQGFHGGVRVATGDLNCDGTSEIITAAGPGGGPNVRVFKADGTPFTATGGTAPTNFFAYQESLTSGVSVAAGDINGDGCDEIITAPGPGVEPKVNIFNDNGTFSGISFDAFDTNFSGGVWVAVGDIDGDGKAEIITGAGPGGNPLVRVWKYDAPSNSMVPVGQPFMAYAPTFSGGVRVATADLNNDGKAEIITGAGPGGGPHVRSFNGDGTPAAVSMFPYPSNFTGGVFVGGGGDKARHSGGIQATFDTGAGPGGGPHVQRFKNANGTPATSFFAYSTDFHGGVFVAQGDFNPLDSDHDGLSDAREVQLGTNPNSADTDSDGISDFIETSPNCPPDGSHPACPHGGVAIDTDHDGKIDAVDTDSDGDGTPDANPIERTGDCNHDGIPNYRDANDNCSATTSTTHPKTTTTTTGG
jgi:hypothetical protein